MLKIKELKIPVSIIKDGKRFVAYSSALDLSTSAMTFELAKKRFDDAATLFFKEIIKMGTMEGALMELGWHQVGTRWLPPHIVSQELESIKLPHRYA